MAQQKPLCLVFDPVRGGAPLHDLEAECDASLQPAIFGPPHSKRDVIPWHRIKDVCIHDPNPLILLYSHPYLLFTPTLP